MKPKKHDRLMERELTPPPNPPLVSSDGMGWEKLQFFYYHQPASVIQEHIQPHYVICINLGNPLVLERRIDGKQQILDELTGDISIYPANTKQAFQWNKNAKFCQILLKPSVLFESFREIFPNENIVFHPDIKPKNDPVISHLGLSLINAVETCGTSSKLYADSIADALAIHLATQYAGGGSALTLDKAKKSGLSKLQLNRVLDYIHSYYCSDISLSELAKVAYLSPYHFSRLFKESTGLSPNQYLIKFRTKQAKQLLLENKISIAEISQNVGFSNQGHLSYHFKRLYDISPKEFRAKK